ncbi:MAG: hypothetical protein ACRDL6_08830 [Solirubrobacterales bacterium]
MAVNVAAASMLSTLIYWLAWRRDLFRSPPSSPELRGYLLASMLPAGVFLASVPIAYLASADATQLSWLSLVVLSPLVGRRSGRDRRA